MINKTQSVLDTLNKLPEVVWDRFSGNIESTFTCFGWIEREDDRSDFIDMIFLDGEFVSFSTSSAEYSEDFAKRLGVDHSPCQRMEDFYGDHVKTTVQNSKKSDKMIRIPISYLFNKSERVGTLHMKEDYFNQMTNRHELVINGKFMNDGRFKTLDITLIKKP